MSIYNTIPNGFKLYKIPLLSMVSTSGEVLPDHCMTIYQHREGLIINTWIETQSGNWIKDNPHHPRRDEEFIKDLTEEDMFTILL